MNLKEQAWDELEGTLTHRDHETDYWFFGEGYDASERRKVLAVKELKEKSYCHRCNVKWSNRNENCFDWLEKPADHRWVVDMNYFYDVFGRGKDA